MKKSLKRFLIISQVLGWSALLASACTDEQVKTISQNTASHEDNKEEQANKAEQEEAEKNAAQQKLENEKKMQGSSGNGTPGEAGAEDKGAGTGTTTEHPIPSQPPVTSHGQEATDQTSH